jgi:hypothetical protein
MQTVIGCIIHRKSTTNSDASCPPIPEQTAWIQEIDFFPSRNLQRQKILQITQTTWIRKGLNLIIIAPTRAGKTDIACTLGQAACQQNLVTHVTSVSLDSFR